MIETSIHRRRSIDTLVYDNDFDSITENISKEMSKEIQMGIKVEIDNRRFPTFNRIKLSNSLLILDAGMIDENKDLEMEGAVGGCECNEQSLNVADDEEVYYYNFDISDEEFVEYVEYDDDQGDDDYDNEDNDETYGYRERISMLLKRH